MFDSLDDQIKHDAAAASTRAQRILPWAAAIVGGVLLVLGLVWGVHQW